MYDDYEPADPDWFHNPYEYNAAKQAYLAAELAAEAEAAEAEWEMEQEYYAELEAKLEADPELRVLEAQADDVLDAQRNADALDALVAGGSYCDVDEVPF